MIYSFGSPESLGSSPSNQFWLHWNASCTARYVTRLVSGIFKTSFAVIENCSETGLKCSAPVKNKWYLLRMETLYDTSKIMG